jgi:hypothetical protein
VLRTKFESADTPADRTALEMLVDVDQSCAAALDVLNGATVPALTYMPLLSCSSHRTFTCVSARPDLLSVDKLENGLLEMHKEATPLLPFLADSMRLFHQEVRAHAMAADHTTGHPDVHLLCASRVASDSNRPASTTRACSSSTAPRPRACPRPPQPPRLPRRSPAWAWWAPWARSSRCCHTTLPLWTA